MIFNSYKSVILFLFITSTVFSQPTVDYVIRIKLGDYSNNNRIEQLELPVLISNKDDFISRGPIEVLERISQSRISYEILDEIHKSDRLFLISRRDRKPFAEKLPVRSIFYNDRQLLAIAQNESDFAHLKDFYQVLEVRQNVSTYRNERYIVQPHTMQNSDTLIQRVLGYVKTDSVREFIQGLQNFNTRFLFANNRDQVAEWIKHQFMSMGYTDVVLDSFQVRREWGGVWFDTWQKNVVATLQGTVDPNSYFVVGGHHDSYSSGNPLVYAPGADDNASGTTAVLEMARAFKTSGYKPEVTIKFVTFAAEEMGLYGGYDYAMKSRNQNRNIRMMINHDMISHSYYSTNMRVYLLWYAGAEYLVPMASTLTQRHTILIPVKGGSNSGGSDSYAFYQYGFPAIYFEEYEFSPYYHQPTDVITNYNMNYCTEVIKASLALLVHSQLSPSPVQDFQIVDKGNGTSLLLRWNANTEADFANYRIVIGTSSGIYTRQFLTTSTTLIVDSLTEGTTYYIGISSVDKDGNESIITEKVGTPYLTPLPTKNFVDVPKWYKIQFNWDANNECDLLGYNIYRAETKDGTPVRLNANPLHMTNYNDSNVVNGKYYFYTVKAIDSTLNEGQPSVQLRSRCISLDQGILIIDDTKDGDGAPMNPTDEQVDEFFRLSTSNFKASMFDMRAEGGIRLSDVGAFSTVVWCKNDMSDFNQTFASTTSLRQYIGYGGKLFYTGYMPTKAFSGMSSASYIFKQGEFAYDIQKIEKAERATFGLFKGALTSNQDYQNIFVDTSKTLQSSSNHLTGIESITALPSAKNIYLYDTKYDSASIQGKLKGMPVGVEYIGADIKVVTLTFPLYYMNFAEARSLIQNVLNDRFGEITSVEKGLTEVPDEFVLLQNYPNPFNPKTAINYRLSANSFIQLKVFDVLGREVGVLENGWKQKGEHTANWDASKMPSGVYFYKIQANGFISAKKMMLMK